MLIPVILSGGSGTRLWPLSTPEKPKQFLPLVSHRTLFQETLLRLHGLPGLAEPIVVCNELHQSLVAEQLGAIGVRPQAVVIEPAGRNTAPAIGVAGQWACLAGKLLEDQRGPDPILLVLPADHVIADAAAFRAAVAKAVRAAQSRRLVTFGIVPTAPETGYGYIEQGDAEGDWHAVARFVEKPDRARAEEYLATGRFLWNSGMFVFRADTLLAELARCAPAIHAACQAAAAAARIDGGIVRLGPEFLRCPSASIDYAVMEKTDSAAVVALDAGWTDVGSWAALYDALPKDADGNVLRGEVVTLDSRNNLVLPGLRKLALLGVDDLVVVDSGETLLILRRERSQDVKELRDRADSAAREV